MVGSREPSVRLERARRRPGLDALLVVRTATTAVAAPWILWKKARRMLRSPVGRADELDPRRWLCPVTPAGARLGRGASPHVVLAGRSYGELRILELLDAGIRARVPGVATTWCGQIREFFEAAARARPRRPVVRFPFDALPSVAGWLARVAPDVVVFVERFRYPMLVAGCASAGVRTVVANAVAWEDPPRRGPLGRYEAWERRALARRISAFCFQSAEQARRAAPYLPEGARAEVTGNVKLDVPRERAGPEAAASLAAWLSTVPRPLLAVGSSRRGDEPFVVEAFRAVRNERPCGLLVAPRQMDRVPEIEAYLRGVGLAVSRRTQPRPGSDVLLLDTIGELPLVYEHVESAFVGGTLRHLGQNFVEALVHGAEVAFGPADVLLSREQEACARAGLGTRVLTPSDLAAHWSAVLARGSAREEVRARAERFLDEHRGALDRTLDVIEAQVREVAREREAVGSTRGQGGDALSRAAAPSSAGA